MKAYLFGVTPVEEAFLKEWQDQHPDDEISYTHSRIQKHIQCYSGE